MVLTDYSPWRSQLGAIEPYLWIFIFVASALAAVNFSHQRVQQPPKIKSKQSALHDHSSGTRSLQEEAQIVLDIYKVDGYDVSHVTAAEIALVMRKCDDLSEIFDWIHGKRAYEEKLMRRLDGIGSCTGCGLIATRSVGSSSGTSHHAISFLRRSTDRGCMLCNLILTLSADFSSYGRTDPCLQISADWSKSKGYVKPPGQRELVLEVFRAPRPTAPDNYDTYACKIISNIIRASRKTTIFTHRIWRMVVQTKYIPRFLRPRGFLLDDPSWSEWKDESAAGSTTPFRHLSQDPQSGDCVALWRSWVSRCLQSHERCGQNSKPWQALPTRLLEIRDNGTIRLKRGEELQRSMKYATLTYCWGQELTLKTTKANLQWHERGIPVSVLPKSLGDAVRVAKHLEIEYLWIDALCIVQDSLHDWETECLRMGDYYANSLVTISALDAASVQIGFLHRRTQVISRSIPSQPATSGFDQRFPRAGTYSATPRSAGVAGPSRSDSYRHACSTSPDPESFGSV